MLVREVVSPCGIWVLGDDPRTLDGFRRRRLLATDQCDDQPDQGGPYKEAWNYKLTHYHQFKEMVIGDQICYDCGDDAPLLQVGKKEAATSVTRRPTPNTATASV